MTSIARRLAAAIAGHDLPGSVAVLPPDPLDEAGWKELRAVVLSERLWGPVGAAVGSGRLPTTTEQADAAADDHRSGMARVLEVEATAVAVASRLGDEGIDYRLLKGLATAHLDHADPSMRGFGDADILIRGEQLAAAEQKCRSMGFDRELPERRAGFDARFGKDVTLVASLELDLHRTLALGAFGLAVDPADLWAAPEHLTLAGRTLHAMDRPRRLAHAFYAAALGDLRPRLGTLRDIAVMLLNKGGSAAAGEAVELCSRWRGEAVAAEALRLTGSELQLPDLPLYGWARSHESDRWSRAMLRSYPLHGGSNTSTLLSGALAPMRPKDRAAYLAALILPSRSYRAARVRLSRSPEWRTGLKELLGRGRSRADVGRSA